MRCGVRVALHIVFFACIKAAGRMKLKRERLCLAALLGVAGTAATAAWVLSLGRVVDQEQAQQY